MRLNMKHDFIVYIVNKEIYQDMIRSVSFYRSVSNANSSYHILE